MDTITQHLLQFAASSGLASLARSYKAEPAELLGALWIRLHGQMLRTRKPIRDMEKWVRSNGYLIAKTYLRKEARHCLHQIKEPQNEGDS